MDVVPRKKLVEPWLVFTSGARGEPVKLPRGSTVLGRGEVGVMVENDGLSREHAKIVVTDDGQVSVLDLNSTNGTYVNGERIELASLREGDELQLGPDVRMSFTHHPPESAQKRELAEREATRLTPRELEVAKLVARGHTSQQIAEQLEISLRTVTSHLDHIYTRLEISSRAALATWVTGSGLLDDA